MGNFGVVTALECALFEQTRFYGGGVWFAVANVPDVVPAWRDWVETLPEEATSSVAVQRLPPLPQLPPPLQGASVLHMRFTHLGSAEEGERLFAPMRALAPAVLENVAGHAELSNWHGPHGPAGADSLLVPDDDVRRPPGEAVDAFVALTGPDSGLPAGQRRDAPSGPSHGRQPLVPNAVATRGLPFVLFAFGAGGPGPGGPSCAATWLG